MNLEMPLVFKSSEGNITISKDCYSLKNVLEITKIPKNAPEEKLSIRLEDYEIAFLSEVLQILSTEK